MRWVEFTVVVFLVSLAALGSESKHQKALKADPRSESNRYAYARYLYDRNRLEEARVQLGELFKLNPKHELGTALWNQAGILMKIDDPKQKREARRRFQEAQVQRQLQSLEAPNQQADYDRLQQIRRRRYNLRYGKLGPSPYSAKQEELVYADKAARLTRNKQTRPAETLFQQWIQAFPYSRLSRIEYTKFLIQERRYKEAQAQINHLQIHFPNDLELRILFDGYQAARSAGSTEQEIEAQLEMQWNLIEAELRRVEARGKAAR